MKYFVILFLVFLVCFKARADEVNCLALNIYHEARNQPFMGKLAVGFVTLNRVKSKEFPNTVCGVVKQGFYYNKNPIKNKCHFSWWCDGKSDKPKEYDAWEYTRALAFQLYYSSFFTLDITNGATHYHADYVNPYWAKDKEKLMQIKNHIFYK
jgi:N-acetylmuramoyl-L-alanine amidase